MNAKELRRKYYQKYQEENREKLNEYQRKWRSKNPDKVKKYNQRYWERKLEIESLKNKIFEFLSESNIENNWYIHALSGSDAILSIIEELNLKDEDYDFVSDCRREFYELYERENKHDFWVDDGIFMKFIQSR